MQLDTRPPEAADNLPALTQLSRNTKPEWLRVPEAVRIFGLSRSALYVLIAAGTIKSTALKKRGVLRGIRLISFDSLAAFIESSCAPQENGWN